jgi:Rieske Fe-S protein
MSGEPPATSGTGAESLGASAGGAGGIESPSRRKFIKTAASYAAVAAGAAVGGYLAGRQVAPVAAPSTAPQAASITGLAEVSFLSSGATSSWHNDKAGEPMKVSDFPGPGYGAFGVTKGVDIKVVTLYLEPTKVAAGMKGIVPPGIAAFNAMCTHLSCTTQWRSEDEAAKLVPVNEGHDLIVCPCHLGTFDPYDSCKTKFGPVPRPLEQLKPVVQDGVVMIEFNNYRFGGDTPQV